MTSRLLMAASLLLWTTLLAPTPVDAQDPASSTDRREQIRQCRLYLKKSLAEFESGELDSALVHLDAAEVCDPKNPDVPYYKGLIYLSRRDTSATVAELTKGVEKAPLSARLKLLLARLKLAAGGPSIDEAGKLIGDVLAIRPRDGEALYLRGLTLLARGDSLAALDSWEDALLRAPDGTSR